MAPRIRRHYINVQGRQVHFRAGGTGPVVMLLHQSPQSSAALLPLAEKLAPDYCVLVPDSPGFGLSAPLPLQEVTIEDIADSLNEFVEAVQAPAPMAVFGVHTGAEIALEFGLRHPDKVGFLILDGLGLFNEAERTDILQHYLPPFAPAWDGSHLAWLWARLREQVIFFPWYRKDSAARMNYDIPDANYLHGWLMDFMYAGDHYRAGYGAAFRYSNSEAISKVIPPTAALYRSGDVLEQHQQRLPSLPDHVVVETVPPKINALDDRVIALLAEQTAGKQPDWACQRAHPTVRAAQAMDYIDIDDRQLAIATAGEPTAPLLVVLHDPGGSAASLQPLLDALSARYRIVCPDLPGHGESAVDGQDGFAIADVVETLSGLLEWTDMDDCRLLSLGAACVFVPALLKHNPGLNITAGLHNPLLLDAVTRSALQDRFAPPITPDEYGTHITRLWYALRDGRLFWPWYDPVAANIRLHTPGLAAEDINQSLFDALRCGSNYHLIWRAFFATDVINALSTVTQPLSVTISKTHPCADRATAALARLPALTRRESADDWTAVIDAHFGDSERR